MYPLGSLLVTLAQILSGAITIYIYLLIGTIIVSWVNADPYNPVVRILRQLTQPLLNPIRRIMPRALFKTGLDFSPLILMLLLTLFKNVVLGSLMHYGQGMLGPPR